MHFYQAYCWERGEYRPANQDSLTIQVVITEIGCIAMAIVCDGVGGLTRGEEASGRTVARMIRWFYQNGIETISGWNAKQNVRRSIHREICSLHAEFQNEDGVEMGTTMTLLLLFNGRYFLYHIGDTQCFYLGKYPNKITVDHVVKKGVLSQCIGYGSLPREQYQCGRYQKGEGFLICSDGFSNKVEDTKMMQLFGEKCRNLQDTERKMQEILQRVRARGEKDNCCAIYLEERREGRRMDGRYHGRKISDT